MIPAQIHVVFRQRNFGLFKLACDCRNAWPRRLFPVLTRTSDIFIPLDTRVEISNRQTNTIFVSIHFNATRKRDIHGIETYYSTARSADLAKLVHSSILRIPGTADRRVHTAAFHVIRKDAFPAILVEGGFLTNSAEAN